MRRIPVEAHRAALAADDRFDVEQAVAGAYMVGCVGVRAAVQTVNRAVAAAAAARVEGIVTRIAGDGIRAALTVQHVAAGAAE